MKRIVILILFIFMLLPVFAEDIIYLDKKWDKEASRILYEYELQDLNITPQKAQEIFDYTQADVRAVFYDLNSDGINEVVGYINARYYYGVLGWQLFILKKDDNSYKNISSINFYPQAGLHILKGNKSHEYCRLGFYEGLNLDYKIMKYNSK